MRVDFFFKIVEIADFEKSTKDFVFVIVVQNARFFQSIKQRFGIVFVKVGGVVFPDVMTAPVDKIERQAGSSVIVYERIKISYYALYEAEIFFDEPFVGSSHIVFV